MTDHTSPEWTEEHQHASEGSGVWCPMGEQNGCEIRDCRGTCGAQRWTLLGAGWYVWVCPDAKAAWVASGSPGPTDEEQHAIVSTAERPVNGRVVPVDNIDRALRDAPIDLDAWAIYTDRQEDRDKQRSLQALACSYDVVWPTLARGGTCPNLILLGHNGTGKTLLLRILGRRAHAAGCTVRFAVFDTLVRQVKMTRDPRVMDTEEQVLAPYLDCDLLILDDIRPVFASQDDENIANQIFHARYGEDHGARNRPTFVSSQLGRTELQHVIGSSAMSRLLQRDAVKPHACDWRAHRNSRRK